MISLTRDDSDKGSVRTIALWKATAQLYADPASTTSFMSGRALSTLLRVCLYRSAA